MKKAIVSIILCILTGSYAFGSEDHSTSFEVENSEDVKKSIEQAKTREEKADILFSSGKKLSLTNYVLGTKVVIDHPHRLSIEEGGQFVPQLDEFIELYLTFIEDGMKPMEAIVLTHTSPQAMEIINTYADMPK